jgi:hypothetical protein
MCPRSSGRQPVQAVSDDVVNRTSVLDRHTGDPVEEPLYHDARFAEGTAATRDRRSSTARSTAVSTSSPVRRARRCASSSTRGEAMFMSVIQSSHRGHYHVKPGWSRAHWLDPTSAPPAKSASSSSVSPTTHRTWLCGRHPPSARSNAARSQCPRSAAAAYVVSRYSISTASGACASRTASYGRMNCPRSWS